MLFRCQEKNPRVDLSFSVLALFSVEGSIFQCYYNHRVGGNEEQIVILIENCTHAVEVGLNMVAAV